MTITRKVKIQAVAVATLLVLGACGDAGEETVSSDTAPPETTAAEPGGDLHVVATTTILGDLVKALVGDDGTVDVLLPVGGDPHDFQMSSQDGVKIRTADLVVANGLGLEESLIAVFESAREDGARILEVGDLVDPMEWGEGREDEHDDHDHDMDEDHDDEGDHDHDEDEDHDDEGDHHGHAHEGAYDPHFWFDPARVESAVRLIAAELIDIGKGVSASEWNARADSYIAEIRAAADEASEILSSVPPDRRKLVTNHDSFSYFGVFFDFEILDTILAGGTTLAQPGTAHLAELVEQIRAEGVPAIFTETTADSGLPMTVAAEFDPPLKVVELYTGSLGEPGSDADTYPKWLVTNARLIADALTP